MPWTARELHQLACQSMSGWRWHSNVRDILPGSYVDPCHIVKNQLLEKGLGSYPSLVKLRQLVDIHFLGSSKEFCDGRDHRFSGLCNEVFHLFSTSLVILHEL